MAYLTRAAKTATAVSVVTLASWKLLEALEAWLDHLTAADDERNPLAGVPYYWAVDASVIVLYPFALWATLRLLTLRGNHLAVVVGSLTWLTLMLQHLDVSTTGNAVRFAIHLLLTAAASQVQATVMPAGTRPNGPTP
ncbi:hypothetical protein [Streptomyces galbus]|uniref:DUF2637 domain-containing protein n=1 Tax=Streptomyces galbus TaxID=33898 RepID=A0A4V6AXC3_STRGB|nr:hypothetical protein [Streptomyces galbus]TKS96712.1 hypothetical protein E4U92_34335 [Streptomyces galbus]GHD54979.1 hypothetical protein GCM10010335_70150 [Streptomyces galbus]